MKKSTITLLILTSILIILAIISAQVNYPKFVMGWTPKYLDGLVSIGFLTYLFLYKIILGYYTKEYFFIIISTVYWGFVLLIYGLCHIILIPILYALTVFFISPINGLTHFITADSYFIFLPLVVGLPWLISNIGFLLGRILNKRLQTSKTGGDSFKNQ